MHFGRSMSTDYKYGLGIGETLTHLKTLQRAVNSVIVESEGELANKRYVATSI